MMVFAFRLHGLGAPGAGQQGNAVSVADPLDPVEEGHLAGPALVAVQQPAGFHQTGTKPLAGQQHRQVVHALRRAPPTLTEGRQVGVVLRQHGGPGDVGQRRPAGLERRLGARVFGADLPGAVDSGSETHCDGEYVVHSR